MSFKKYIFVPIAAFGLGFYASEYRHSQNQQQELPAITTTPVVPAVSSHSLSRAESNNHSQSSVTQVQSRVTTALPELSSLEHVRQLIANNEFPAAVSLLNQVLQKEPGNTEALLLLARVLEKQGQHEQAVASWFRYLNLEIDARKIEEALTYLSRYLIRLVNNPGIFGASREWLMTQLNDLIKLTPDNGELHLQLADMHMKAADQEQAQYHALMAANQDNTRARAEEFMAKMADATIAAQTADHEISVQLIRFGPQFLVPVTVEDKKVKLLLDTGASISGLTSSFINRNYGFVKSPKPIQLNTASGTVESFLFVVDSLQIAELTFNKHMLARLPMDNFDSFDGLLGVDILGRFDFVIDQEKAILRLRKRQ
jgi:predicted aspartyl protease